MALRAGTRLAATDDNHRRLERKTHAAVPARPIAFRLILYFLCSELNISNPEVIMADASFSLSATERQLAYARTLALRNQVVLPWAIQQIADQAR